MPSNFIFLKAEFPEIYREITEAEKHTFTAPRYAALLCRSTLEKTIFWLYQNDDDLELPYDTKLGALLHNDSFKAILKPSMLVEMDVVRLYGNNAAHGKNVRQLEALQSLKNTFRFLSWLSKYYSEKNPEIPAFSESYIPYGDTKDKSQKQLQELASSIEKEREEAKKLEKKQLLLAEENELLKKQLEAQKQIIAERKEFRRQEFTYEQAVPELTSEHQTRKVLIDLLLKEAGWDNLREGKEIEYEVTGMPLSTNPTGMGYVDYVLWDDNGKPLAVVEAKSTLHDARKGKHQATLYADCLEKMTGQRPVIFYTNGFQTHLWDDQFYPDRLVQGFYTKEELQVLIRRRYERLDLRNFVVNTAIIERDYQLEAVKRVAEALVTTQNNTLRGKHRKALLVMATGSGKTRTAAAIVDMFTKCNWAKRILFLADRNALVTQAKNAFKEHLPNLSAIDLTKEKEDVGTRVVFSTYPTILNKIDSLKNEEERFYGIGHFDVIIIDEAHRSVYQKYQAIFDYFDSILIGLTATPKKDIDKNTYSLFEIEDDVPTFAYELDRAVAEKHLVPPKAYKVPVKFPRKGVKYAELSERDKRRYEELFGVPGDEKDTGITEISKTQVNSFLFNNDTVDTVLDYLMRYGQRVESGDKLGKTIIFAKNHTHAVFIEERFNKNYPEYGGGFLRVIDNYEDKAQDLLEKFCFFKGDDKDPQIAVSVDMMDTGVDAPRVLNLIFFKEVKSYAKYWQMIGRGTRKCPDIFGKGQDKEFFLIFDICGNFEFFEEFPNGYEGNTSKPLSQQLFEGQLEIITTIQNNQEVNESDENLAKAYTDKLHLKIAALDHSRFEVKKHLEYVIKYSKRENWNSLNQSDILDIQTHLSHLVAYTDDKDEFAKQFDRLIYQLQLAILKQAKKQVTLIQNITNIGELLFTKRNIPAVGQHLEIITKIKTSDYWETISLEKLESLREELRSLIQFLKDDNKVAPIYSDFDDELIEANVKEADVMGSYTKLQSYKDRVESFIRKNRTHLVIDKLYKNIPITPGELEQLEQFLMQEAESKERLFTEYDEQPLGMFVRKILGLDIEAAHQHFATFIQEENLNANQITFVKTIIDYLNKNGILDKKMLTQSPFNAQNDNGIFGVFQDEEDKLIKVIQLVEKLNQNALIG
ncbi:DEAD/DEAH box helicase family protein [Flavobacterium sedimenticola]|uniref:DEAD/DEAH box helicase family protein n=1 Tax=Flavobacterium sedimenticola TaxID=3043286 RepID=A0ABT6XTP5_9FLAO|nr:DEAD/DEAH box helicase family protein [Flavobacterium sedimenticola]MDI9258182.1 DEAD/DEAH box helicase family protein [Flavobacterium sedimenticola]